MIKQITIFVENKFGEVAKIIDMLGNNDIDISALSIADTTDFGILRMIVDKPDLATEVLKNDGIMAKSTDVIGVAIDDKPGGLARALKVLTQNDIVIEYMYAFMGKKLGKAMTVLKTDNMEKTLEVLRQNDIEILI